MTMPPINIFVLPKCPRQCIKRTHLIQGHPDYSTYHCPSENEVREFKKSLQGKTYKQQSLFIYTLVNPEGL